MMRQVHIRRLQLKLQRENSAVETTSVSSVEGGAMDIQDVIAGWIIFMGICCVLTAVGIFFGNILDKRLSHKDAVNADIQRRLMVIRNRK